MLADVQEQTYNTIQETQMPYAMMRLEEAARIIRQSINELPTLRRRLDKNMESKYKARDIYGDLQNQHRRLINAFDTAALSLLEAEQDELANHSVKLRHSVENFNLMTPDYTKLCSVLSGYVYGLPISEPVEPVEPVETGNIIDIATSSTDTVNKRRTTNNRIIGRLMNNVRMGYYPTCTDNIGHIVRGLDFPEGGTVNLLDPCCGCGLALRTLADGATDNGVDSKTFGIELDTYRAEEALTRLDRVGFGSYFHSRTGNEAFHAMLLNPPYLRVMTEGGNNTRSEKNFLVDSISNLMTGGLLIYIIPYYRLTADVARILCDNFSDISVWRFTDSEFRKFKQVAVLGSKQKKIDGSEPAHELSSLVLQPEDIPQLSEMPPGRYKLPATIKEVGIFKGAIFNETELANQLNNSKSLSRLFQRSKLDKTDKRPLLPLSIGQIGLVGGSGLINGLVDCDTPHIIKGRIVKEKRVSTEVNTDEHGNLLSATMTETISNKLIFNLLTPNGFISLTDYGSNGAIFDSDDDPSEDRGSHLGHSVSYTPCAKPVIGNTDTGSDGIKTNAKRLPMGRTVVTRTARKVLTGHDIHSALRRHESHDWGNVSESDRKSNDRAVKNGDRILSSYQSSDGETFWINTEWDRSVTTVMLPEDY